MVTNFFQDFADYITQKSDTVFDGIGTAVIIFLVPTLLAIFKKLVNERDYCLAKFNQLIDKINRKLLLNLFFLSVLYNTYQYFDYKYTKVTILNLASGPDGGTFIAFANDLKTLLEKEKKIFINEKQSEGSIENLENICHDKSGAQLALVHTGILFDRNDSTDSCANKIGAIAHIYDAVLYIAIDGSKVLNIHSVEDIRQQGNDLNIYAGPELSGTRAIVNKYLVRENLLPTGSQDKINDNGYLNFTAAANMLGHGIDICIFLVEPHAQVIDMLRRRKVRFIGFKDTNTIKSNSKDQLDDFIDPVYNINTFKVKEFLVARKDIPNDSIFYIAEFLHNNSKNFSKSSGHLSEKPCVAGSSYEYLNEAIRYYKSIGELDCDKN